MSKPELTVVTFCWRGWRGAKFYNAMHVNALGSMLKQHLTMPHRFVCVTDDPKGITGETVALWPDPGIQVMGKRPNSYTRLRLFSNEAKHMFGPKILQLDLDCVILQNIDSLITDDAFKIMYGKAAPYNGSMWQVKPGVHDHVWSRLHLNVVDEVRRHAAKTHTRMYGSDQAWMSYKLPGAPMWKQGDGAYHFTLLHPECGAVARSPLQQRRGNTPVPRGPLPPPDNAKIVFFAGAIKPWSEELGQRSPVLYETYRKHLNTNFTV